MASSGGSLDGTFPSFQTARLNYGYEQKICVASFASHSLMQERWVRACQQSSCIDDALGRQI